MTMSPPHVTCPATTNDTRSHTCTLSNATRRTIQRTILCAIIVAVCAAPLARADHSSQQEQELLLLDALSKRLPGGTATGSGGSYATNSLGNYGSSNSIMDMLGRSKLLTAAHRVLYYAQKNT